MIVIYMYQDVNFTKVIVIQDHLIVVSTQYLQQFQIMLPFVQILRILQTNIVDILVEVLVQL